MLVSEIVALVNQYSDEQLPTEQVVLVVRQAVQDFNQTAGLMVPSPPPPSDKSALNYNLTYTAKCPDIPEDDPQHKELQPKVDNFNARMRAVDDTIVSTCIVQYATAHVKLQEEDNVVLVQNWESKQQQSYNQTLSRFAHFFNRDYRIGTTPGSEHVGSGVTNVKRVIRQPDPVCSFLRKIGYKQATKLLGRSCELRQRGDIFWERRY